MHIIVTPTYKCGLDCPYCGYAQLENTVKYKGSGVELDKTKEITIKEWIDLFDKYKANSIEFTGGEPLKYKDFPKLTQNLNIPWAITSNTLNSKIREVNLSNCVLWTASFHPHVGEKGINRFFNNIRYISSKNVPMTVTLVATPEDIHNTLRWANRINNMGLKVFIHPYYDDPEFKWKDHPKELEFLAKSKYVAYGDMMLEYKGIEGSKKCSAGRDYLLISPQGKVFRCLADMMFGRKDINKISTEDIECSEKCVFPCDIKRVIK